MNWATRRACPEELEYAATVRLTVAGWPWPVEILVEDWRGDEMGVSQAGGLPGP